MEKEKKSILIIDDDPDILMMLSLFLSEKGYAVDTAKTGAEAIEKSKAKIFNLALIDIVLPDIQGTQLLIRLKDTEPRMRKIIITGYASLDNAVEALNLGADAYIMKPVDPKDLLKVIEEQLHKQRKETVITQKKIAQFIETRKANFIEVVKQSLNSYLGRSTALLIIHHLGGAEALRDPNIFAERLKAVFKEKGAEIILKQILDNLEKTSEKP